jgi:hypothetical protein
MRMLTRTEARLLLREQVALSWGLAMPMVLLGTVLFFPLMYFAGAVDSAAVRDGAALGGCAIACAVIAARVFRWD